MEPFHGLAPLPRERGAVLAFPKGGVRPGVQTGTEFPDQDAQTGPKPGSKPGDAGK
jgi:hypothetical protein